MRRELRGRGAREETHRRVRRWSGAREGTTGRRSGEGGARRGSAATRGCLAFSKSPVQDQTDPVSSQKASRKVPRRSSASPPTAATTPRARKPSTTATRPRATFRNASAGTDSSAVAARRSAHASAACGLICVTCHVAGLRRLIFGRNRSQRWPATTIAIDARRSGGLAVQSRSIVLLMRAVRRAGDSAVAMLQKRALPQATDGQNVEPCGQFAGPSVCTELAACNTLGIHSKPPGIDAIRAA